jgi:hypothetical protein
LEKCWEDSKNKDKLLFQKKIQRKKRTHGEKLGMGPQFFFAACVKVFALGYPVE